MDFVQDMKDLEREIKALKADKRISFQQLNFRQFEYTSTMTADVVSKGWMTEAVIVPAGPGMPVFDHAYDPAQMADYVEWDTFTEIDSSGKITLRLYIHAPTSPAGKPLTVQITGLNIASVSWRAYAP